MDWRQQNSQMQIPHQGYGGAMQPNAAVRAYEDKWQYELAKTNLEIDKNRIKYEQQLAFEAQREEIKIQSRVRQEMMSYEVYRDAMGRMIFTRIGANEEKLQSKVLLNVLNFEAAILFSSSAGMPSVLAISWEGCGRNKIFFENKKDGILPQKFLRCLKARGIILQVSKRSEKDIAEALLAYAINTEKIIEMPFCRGWNVMENGKWYFAKNDEMTMVEVLQNAC